VDGVRPAASKNSPFGEIVPYADRCGARAGNGAWKWPVLLARPRRKKSFLIIVNFPVRFSPSFNFSLSGVALLSFVVGLRAETPISFERDIQPILSENCYHCHGPDGEARKLIVLGFIEDTVNRIGHEAVEAMVCERIEEKFARVG